MVSNDRVDLDCVASKMEIKSPISHFLLIKQIVQYQTDAYFHVHG